MKEKISALIDGALPQEDAGRILDEIKTEGVAREDWRCYQLIGETMRASPVLSAGFAARVAERIAREPTVLAPVRREYRPIRQPLWALSAAASLMAVALVGWIAFGPQEEPRPEPRLVRSQAQAVAQQEAPRVAPPAAANDYLLAHQGYSPRNSLQGVAPYVRTVSGDMRGPRR